VQKGSKTAEKQRKSRCHEKVAGAAAQGGTPTKEVRAFALWEGDLALPTGLV